MENEKLVYTDMENAWLKVFDLCKELGMNTDNMDSGFKNVKDFIVSLYNKQIK